MSFIATSIVGGTIVGGYLANEAADAQSDAITDASMASVNESARQFDLVRKDTKKYRKAGEEGLRILRRAARGNMNAFYESPDYQFNLEQGQKALDRSMVARTGGLGGRAVKEGIRFASGLASSQYADWWNRIAAQAGIGQTAVGQSGTAGMQAANQIGSSLMQAGQVRGNAAVTGAAGTTAAIQGGIQNYMLYDYLQPQAAASRPLGNASAMNTWRGR